MRSLIKLILLFSSLTIFHTSASDFTSGPVFQNYGQNAIIENGLAQPESQHFKVAFDVAKQSEVGSVNRSFDSLARFINMHVRAGVPLENIELALVVHGKASFDLMSSTAYQEKFEQESANTELLALLVKTNTKLFICGQSASYHGIKESQLDENVEMSLSAMTIHALLQQQGYSLNPF